MKGINMKEKPTKETSAVAMYSDYINKLSGEFNNTIDIVRILYLAKAYSLGIGLDNAFSDIKFTNYYNEYGIRRNNMNYNLDANDLRKQVFSEYYGSIRSFVNNNNTWKEFDMIVTNEEKKCINFVMLKIPTRLRPYLIYGGAINNNAYLPVLSDNINVDDMREYYSKAYFKFLLSHMNQIKREWGYE